MLFERFFPSYRSPRNPCRPGGRTDDPAPVTTDVTGAGPGEEGCTTGLSGSGPTVRQKVRPQLLT